MYIIEGVNNKGELLTCKLARIRGETTQQSVDMAAYALGISSYYSWYEV